MGRPVTFSSAGVLPEASWRRRWVTPVLCSSYEAPPAAPPAPRSESSRLQGPPGPPAGAMPREELPSAGRDAGARAPSSAWSSAGLDPG